MNLFKSFFLASLAFVALALIACPTSDERGQVLTLKISEKNDSLLHFDSLVVTVHSKDGNYSQEVFHGILRDPSQVTAMPLDSRVGDEYTISIIGYNDGKIGVNKEVSFIGSGSLSKDLPIKIEKPETVVVVPNFPEIIVPSDTNIFEGDSLRFRVSVRNPWGGTTALSIKNAANGATLDTAGHDAGEGYLAWRPNFEQGRSEPYAITFVYSSTTQKVEQITRVKVSNTNRPPKFATIPDQKAKESEQLSFKVDASDPDHDSLILAAADLPTGAAFTGNTFTWKPNEGQANNYSVKFKAFDGVDSGVLSVLISVGNVDAPPPVTIEITSPSRDTLVNFTPITLLYTVNGNPLQRKFPLKDGKNRIRIDTTILGRAGYDTVLVILDSTPPAPPLVSGISPVRTRTPVWTWLSGGNGSGIYRYRLDSEDMSGSTTLSDTTYSASKDLDPGTHTLFVQERDAAGNWSAPGKRAVRIDTTRPAPPSVTVKPTTLTNNPIPTWDWTSSGDDLSGLFRYKLDTNDFRTGAVESHASNFTPQKALKDGVHSLFVQQQDSAGNWSISGSATIQIDATPPNSPVFAAPALSPLNSLKPIWKWASGGNGGMSMFRAKLDDSLLETGAMPISSTQFAPPEDLKEGMHTLYLQERDSVGNWSPLSRKTLVLALRGIVGNAGFSTSDISEIPIAFNSEGEAFIACAGSVSNLAVKRLTGSIWKDVTIDQPTPGTAVNLSLAFNNKGVLHIAYADEDSGRKAFVKNLVGSTWKNVGLPVSPGEVAELTMAFNNSGVPYLAYSDKTNGWAPIVKKLVGSEWKAVGSASPSVGGASNLCLKFNSLGELIFGFTDVASEGVAVVKKLVGSEWKTVGGPGLSSGKSSSLALAIGPADQLFAGVADDGGGTVTVKTLSGTEWKTVGNSKFPTDSRSGNLVLEVDKSGTPYIAYCDAGNQWKATVKAFIGSEWKELGAGGISKGTGYDVRLALSPLGVPYIAFADGEFDGKATVMKASFDP